MDFKCFKLLLLGGAVRLYFSHTPLASLIGNRVEFATPLNSFKRSKYAFLTKNFPFYLSIHLSVQEGVFLLQQGIDPYKGDLVHETPLLLKAVSGVFIGYAEFLPLLYILFDLCTAWLLHAMSSHFVKQKLKEQKLESKNYAEDTVELQYSANDTYDISKLVLIAYLFNPLALLSCIGLTSTVLSNFLLATFLYALIRRQLLVCLVLLAFETVRSLYPVVLIAPLLIIFAKRSVTLGITIFILFATCCMAIACGNFLVMNSWNFLDGTLGFMYVSQ